MTSLWKALPPSRATPPSRWPLKRLETLALALSGLALAGCAYLPGNHFAARPVDTYGDVVPPADGRGGMTLSQRIDPPPGASELVYAPRSYSSTLSLPPAGQTAAELDAAGIGVGTETYTPSPDRPAVYYASLSDTQVVPPPLPPRTYYQNRATVTGRLDTLLDPAAGDEAARIARLPPERRPRMPQVAQPTRQLRLAYQPSDAWKDAVIPVGTRRLVVGRVPPPILPTGPTIGVGDTVALSVAGRPEFTSTVTVSADGRVPVTLLGPVSILGLSPSQVSDRIADGLKRGGYLVNPQVSVLLTDSLNRQFSVLGEVKLPGRFPLKTRLSVVDALALAGGVAETGGSVAYVLRPEGEKVTRYEINLDSLVQQGEGQQFFELLPNDSVIVPRAEQVFIYGQVKQPAAFRLRPGMTVIQVLSLAGGLTDRGTERNIEIRHRDPDGHLETRTATLEDPLGPGDVVYVRERLF